MTMMSRNPHSRQLKRVSGDAYLAPMKLNQNRPVSSGVPLKRCSNNTSMDLSKSNAVTFPSKDRFSKQERLERYRHKSRTKPESSSATTIKRKNKEIIISKSVADNDSNENGLQGSRPCSSLLTTGLKYVVPTNTAITSSTTATTTRSRSTFTTGESINGFKEMAFKYKNPDDDTVCLYTDATAMGANENNSHIMKNPKRSPRAGSLSSCTVIMSATNASSITEQPIVKNESTPVEEITTATSLELPASNKKLQPPTRSDDWSLKYQMPTTRSIGSATTNHSQVEAESTPVFEKSSKNLQSSKETTIAWSKVGDGDAIKTPPGSHKVSERKNTSTILALSLPPPPTSPVTSPTKKPSFTLTFRKPKARPRPRSIVTNSSSNKATLSSSASTPNPLSPVLHASPREFITERPDFHKQWNNLSGNRNENEDDINNNINVLNNNNNDSNTLEEFVKSSKEFCEDKDILEPILVLNKSAIHEKNVTEAMPANIAYQSMAVGGQQPYQTEATNDNIYEPDAAFWHSDSTLSDHGNLVTDPAMQTPHQHHHHHHNKHQEAQQDPNQSHVMNEQQATEQNPNPQPDVKEKKTSIVSIKDPAVDSQKTDTNKSGTQEESDSHSSVKSPSEAGTVTSYKPASTKQYSDNSYNPYSQSYSYGSTQFEAEGPFLRTEKGAIRFHLPGRIQHKTTIKVAHFPTGEDKNVNLNLKPDQEEEVCEEVPASMCANNQNFVVPPQNQYTPYSYNPYYGYATTSPYSLENYYRYYGYPPYC